MEDVTIRGRVGRSEAPIGVEFRWRQRLVWKRAGGR